MILDVSAGRPPTLLPASGCAAACAGALRPARGPGALRALSVEAERGAGGGGQFAFTCGMMPTQVFAIGMNYASHAKAQDSQKLPLQCFTPEICKGTEFPEFLTGDAQACPEQAYRVRKGAKHAGWPRRHDSNTER